MCRVSLLWTGPKNVCAGMLKNIFHAIKLCTCSIFSNLVEPIFGLSKSCPKIFLWTNPKNFCAGMLKIIFRKIKLNNSNNSNLKVFQQVKSCDSLAFLDLKSWKLELESK
jgi:hypothetical protein